MALNSLLCDTISTLMKLHIWRLILYLRRRGAFCIRQPNRKVCNHCNVYEWRQAADISCLQQLEGTWQQIDRLAEQDQAVLEISKDIKSELGGFHEKVDVSSNITSEDHRWYRLLFSRFFLGNLGWSKSELSNGSFTKVQESKMHFVILTVFVSIKEMISTEQVLSYS